MSSTTRPRPSRTRIEPVDLVFDTAGGERLDALGGCAAPGRADRLGGGGGRRVLYFVVEPNRDQLAEIGRLADTGRLRVAIDQVFSLDDAPAAFARVAEPGTRGKVVLVP